MGVCVLPVSLQGSGSREVHVRGGADKVLRALRSLLAGCWSEVEPGFAVADPGSEGAGFHPDPHAKACWLAYSCGPGARSPYADAVG